MFHLLPCLTTFNIVGYITERELNKSCGDSSICNSLHIELHLICSCLCTWPCHASLNRTCIIIVCASCPNYVMVVYYVVCSFPVLLLRVGSGNVVIVRTRSTMSICLLHGLVLLPCGISGKMTIPSKSLLSLLASCSLFCYAYAAIPTTCLSCLPYCWTKPLTHIVLANHWLAMLLLCSAPLIALLVAGEDWSLFLVGTWRSFLVGTLFNCWDITIYLI